MPRRPDKAGEEMMNGYIHDLINYFRVLYRLAFLASQIQIYGSNVLS